MEKEMFFLHDEFFWTNVTFSRKNKSLDQMQYKFHFLKIHYFYNMEIDSFHTFAINFYIELIIEYVKFNKKLKENIFQIR